MARRTLHRGCDRVSVAATRRRRPGRASARNHRGRCRDRAASCAAKAAASPPLDPPGVRVASHGFLVAPAMPLSVCQRNAMSGRFVRPIGIAPAPRKCSTIGASRSATASANATTPWVVGVPATSMFSFTVNGTPASGPTEAPRAIAASTASAAQRLFVEHAGDRVDLGVAAGDPFEMRGDDLAARHLSATDQGSELDGASFRKVRHDRPLVGAANLWRKRRVCIRRPGRSWYSMRATSYESTDHELAIASGCRGSALGPAAVTEAGPSALVMSGQVAAMPTAAVGSPDTVPTGSRLPSARMRSMEIECDSPFRL